MVSMEAVQTGIAKFIDRDIAPSLNGWDRVIVAGAGGLLTANIPNIIAQYAGNPIVSAMGIYDKDRNTVDIDALYKAAKPYMGADALPVKIPVVNITIKIGKKEMDTLYAYIQEGA